MRPVSAASVSRKFPCHEMMIARRACTPAGIAVCVGAQAAKAAAATDTGPPQEPQGQLRVAIIQPRSSVRFLVDVVNPHC